MAQNVPLDTKAKILEFQEAAANKLLEKSGFRYNEPWYREFKKFFLENGLSLEKYEDAVVYLFLGIDLVEHKKKF